MTQPQVECSGGAARQRAHASTLVSHSRGTQHTVTNIPSTTLSRANYGIDAPGVVRAMLVGGGASLIAGIILAASMVPALRGYDGVGGAFIWMGAAFLLGGAMMLWSSRIGKLHARDVLLNRLSLDPAASVLDVGCGHGLLLIGAAKRVPQGRAVGLDLWSLRDQHANSREATLANAAAEGVSDRVEVHDGDMREIPFASESFDAVVSSLAIHNVSTRADRQRAIAEIVRVLRPGGQVAIMDIGHVGQYADDLRAAGMNQVRPLGFTPWIFPPTRTLIARK